MPDDPWTRAAPARSDALLLMDLAAASGDLDRLLERARRTLDVRVASIRLIDGGARVSSPAGTAYSPAGRETAFCRHAIAAGRPFVVPDAARDGRFSAEPLVTGGPRIRFYAGIPLAFEPGRPIGTLCLFDTRPRLLSAAQTFRLADLADDAAAAIARRRDAATIGRLSAELEAQASLIREQAASMAHGRRTFEQASAAARIGVWECRLRDEALCWTDTVYDIFEIPRGSALDRQRTLEHYPEPSLKALQTIRSRAIAERAGFNLDAEIVTAKGRRRWIRLTATVECEDGVAVRIFGMKQDITEEKIQSDRTRYLAEFDLMTGLANRALFQSRLSDLCERRAGRSPGGALLLVDLDGFKQVNDTFGHALGDECLKEAARRLGSVCRGTDLVARIGGDEFAVLLGAPLDRSAVEGLAGRIVETLHRPVADGDRSYRLGASVGVALLDGCTPSELFTRADTALYAAKAAGRNTVRMFGPALMHAAQARLPRRPDAMPAGALTH